MRKKSSEKYYRQLKEEFYSLSGLPVITPANAMEFIDRLSKTIRGIKPHFQEVMSGTARLTSVVFREGLRVMPPLDYRYGWDLSCLHHQRLASNMRKTFGLPVVYYSPTCRPWSIASNSQDPDVRWHERQLQMPTLEWLRDEFKDAVKLGNDCLFESPLSSAMWQQSPISECFTKDGPAASCKWNVNVDTVLRSKLARRS